MRACSWETSYHREFCLIVPAVNGSGMTLSLNRIAGIMLGTGSIRPRMFDDLAEYVEALQEKIDEEDNVTSLPRIFRQFCIQITRD